MTVGTIAVDFEERVDYDRLACIAAGSYEVR